MSRKKQRSRRAKPARKVGAAETPAKTRRLFWLLMSALVALPLVAIGVVASNLLDPGSWAEERLLRFAATRMTAEEKEAVNARLARLVPGLWHPVPEPAVGYILQRQVAKSSKGTTVRSNRAGMRAGGEYTLKRPDVFRIVCLGDSLVMGTGGREEDRWGDQMEAILGDLGVTVGGRRIEVLSLGLDGWSALNEATYLASRISAYNPDVVLAMMFQNDITDSGAVLGTGVVTYGFSSQHRADGSGVMAGHWPNLFGLSRLNFLHTGLGPESGGRWAQTFQAWRRLEDLVGQSGGKMMFSILGSPPHFRELAKLHFERAGMRSPFLFTGYFNNSLPHDPHPDRQGHRILATHYLHAMASLGWLPVAAADLPALHSRLDLETVHPASAERLTALQARFVARLPESIAFDRLSEGDVQALLGGIYPGADARRLTTLPFATLKSVFLLRRSADAGQLLLEIEVPPRPELYPFHLDMALDGESAAKLVLATREQAGRHVLAARLPTAGESPPALEVLLRTTSYFSVIDNDVMRSYRLVAVRQQ